MSVNAPVWTSRVDRNDISDNGLRVDLEADKDVRSALEKAAGVRNLKTLKAFFDLTRRGDDIRVVGEVSASMVQDCVVTLDPIEQNILEKIDLIFVAPPPGHASERPRGRPAPDDAEASNTEFDAEANGEFNEPTDFLVEGAVDLGALVVEYFLLGVDPYPRKPGAEFTPPAAATPAESPFAALAALKKTDPGPG